MLAVCKRLMIRNLQRQFKRATKTESFDDIVKLDGMLKNLKEQEKGKKRDDVEEMAEENNEEENSEYSLGI